MQKIFFSTLLLLFATNCASHPGVVVPRAEKHPVLKPAEPAMPKVTRLQSGVSIHHLNNGMEVLLIENPALPMTGVNVLVKIGSAYENFATSGMSHMLEHLLFNGTTTRTQKQLYDDVDLIGGYNNATTSTYYTNYMMVTPSENSLRGMEIQADMLFHSVLPVENFDKEKGIVLEEIAQSLTSPGSQIERNCNAVLFEGHALSLPTLGTYATIKALDRDDVERFYRNAYVPNNMILTAIGNFQADSMLARIERIYGAARPGSVELPADPGWATGKKLLKSGPFRNEQVKHRFYTGDKTQLDLFYPLPTGQTAEFYSLLETALSSQIDSLKTRIKHAFPEDFESVTTGTVVTPVNSFLRVSATLNSENNLTTLNRMIGESVAKLRPRLGEAQLESNIVQRRTNFLKNIEKPHMFGIYNTETLAGSGIEAVLASYSDEGTRQAAEYVRRFRLNPRPVIIIHHPQAGSSLQETDAAIPVIDSTDPQTGLTVIVRQNPGSGLLAIHFLVEHKARLESAYGRNAAKILHDCLEQRLTTPANLKASNRFGLTYTVNDNPYIPMDNIYLHPDFGYIRVEGLADDAAGAISFLNSTIQDFTPTEQEFERAAAKFKSSGHSMGGDKARDLFEKAWKSAIYSPEKYAPGPDSLSYQKLLEFSRQYLCLTNMIISVVSPLPPDSITRIFNRSVNPIETPAPPEPAVETPFTDLTESQSIESIGGGEQSYLFWGFLKTIDPADAPVLQALSLVLSDRIVFDIREKQGMAYRMSAGVDINQDKALFYIRLGTRPQNVDTLTAQFPGFFSRDMLTDLTALDLQKSINMYLGRMMFRRLSSINQAYYLGHSKYFHGNVNYDAEFHDRLKKITVSDLNEIAGKYLLIENPVTVIVR